MRESPGAALSGTDLHVFELNPRQLHQFEALAEMGSATKACRYLGISQSGLTQSISRLETDLGVTLFDRSTRPARLTNSGRHLLEYVRSMSVQAEALREKLALELGQQSGTLRIGCGPRWMVDIIPRAMDRFMQDFPEVQIHIRVDQMDTLRQMLDEQQISLMFGTTDAIRRLNHHRVVEMGQDFFTVVARSDHPLQARENLTLEELAQEHWIVGAPSASSTAVLRQLLREAGLPPVTGTVHLSDTLAVANTIRQTDCIGIFSSSTVRNFDDIDALSVDFALPESRSGVLYISDLSDPQHSFVEHVRTVFEETPASAR